jgi:hypothetical protein
LQQIEAVPAMDFANFHARIAAQNEPVIIRSLVADWPAVKAGKVSAASACDYLLGKDAGLPVYTIAAPPEAGGRFFYNEDLQSVNFNRGQIPLSQVLQKLLDNIGNPAPHSIAVQALGVRHSLPGFESENGMPLMETNVEPTMWIGNKGRVSPHYDVHKNLACVMAGRREFTLFPPEQIANLYPGPVLNAPGGVPISLVDVQDPDLDRFPRYSIALEHARSATLEPGDAIFIPSLWWHAVASLETINVLVNYWWAGYTATGISANDTLLHGMLSIAALDDEQRRAWKSFFDYYVFSASEQRTRHLPGTLRDISTSITAEQLASIKAFLGQRLSDDT